jgi:exodeoxyribonuclease-3
MKIISWNVNGLRAVLKKNFFDFLQSVKPDILCLQETRMSDTAWKKEGISIPGYNLILNHALRPGYSGTGLLIKEGIKYKLLPKVNFDHEGRVQVIDLGKYYLANIYFPNARPELARIKFKLKFNNSLLKYFKTLAKPLIVTGDFNVAHSAIDLARPKENEGNPGYSSEERNWFNKFLSVGFVDSFRYFYPKKIQYSWWSHRQNARSNNVGWRIDYFCVSDKVVKDLKKAYILDKILGSDHCPIGLEIK